MNRFALTAAIAFGLTLTACQNQPEEDGAGSSEDSIQPTAPDMADGDQIVSEGPTDDATPYAGTTGGANGGSDSGGSTAIASSGQSGSSTMQSGSSTAGQRPPKGSKLQRAD